MDEKTREKIALFRYGLIAPLLNGQQDSKSYFESLEGKVHQVPYYGERKFAAKKNAICLNRLASRCYI